MRTLILMMSFIVVIVLLLSSVQLSCTSECSQGSHPQSRSAASTDDGWGLDGGGGGAVRGSMTADQWVTCLESAILPAH